MRPKVPFEEIENLTFFEKGEDKKITNKVMRNEYFKYTEINF